MVWKIDDPQGNEAAKVKYDVVPFTRGVVLDLGCGPFKAFPHFIGVDNGHHALEFGWRFKPDISVETCERLEGAMTVGMAKRLGVITDPEDDRRGDLVLEGPHRVPDASCDAVFSSHLLEHIEDTTAALAEWWRVVKPDGYLVLYLPHKDMYPNVGHEGANPDHKHDFLPTDIIAAMLGVARGFELVVHERRDARYEYSFLQVYRKRTDGVQDVEAWQRAREALQGRKTACVVRYGGIGDMIMMSSILPQLRAKGLHVTVMTTPIAQEIVRFDPNIDAFLIQDTDQVPNGELPEYWAAWARKFDVFVNLSESVESTFLGTPGRANHAWPDALRHKYMNENYVEFSHALAGLEHRPRPRFHATDAEMQRVKDFRAKFPEGAYVVLWALAGSSPHKVYPHMDTVIAQLLLKRPNVFVIMVGDHACQILESSWEGEGRVCRLSGKLGIRETLALACHGVECVVGPETGVLNAVSHLKVPKVIMLSHSSVKNLTRDWANTVSLTPPPLEAPCYPCHRIHHDRKWCPDKRLPLTELGDALASMSAEDRAIFDEHTEDGKFSTGAALCAWAIAPERVTSAILAAEPKRIVVPA